MNRMINYETPEFAVVRFDVDKRIMNGVDFSGNEGDGETVEFDTTAHESFPDIPDLDLDY